MQTEFEIVKSHCDVDVDSAAFLFCPLIEGVHNIPGDDFVFDAVQWVAVVKKDSKWFAALADNEGEALDIFLGRDGQDGNLEELEIWEGELRLNLF